MLRKGREDARGETEMEMSDWRKTAPFCIPAGTRKITTRNKGKRNVRFIPQQDFHPQ